MKFIAVLIGSVVGVFLLIFIALLIMDFSFQNISDFDVNRDKTIYAGEGEPCKTFNTENECLEGLECVLISTYPYENGLCMKPNSTLEEDLTNRDSTTVVES